MPVDQSSGSLPEESWDMSASSAHIFPKGDADRLENEQNCYVWSIRMKNAFEACKMWYIVNGSKTIPSDDHCRYSKMSDLPTTLRFEHTVHVQLQTHLPSSSTLEQWVTYILTMQISSRWSPPLLVLSMDSHRVAGILKDAAKPNCLLNYQPVVTPVSSYRVRAMCPTPLWLSFLSLALTTRTAIHFLVMAAVLLSRIRTMASYPRNQWLREKLYSLEQRAPTDSITLICHVNPKSSHTLSPDPLCLSLSNSTTCLIPSTIKLSKLWFVKSWSRA